jgi:5'-nucleotidase
MTVLNQPLPFQQSVGSSTQLSFQNQSPQHSIGQLIGSSAYRIVQKQSQDHRIHRISLDTLKQIFQNQLDPTTWAAQDKKSFTILFTGDTHSHLEPSFASFVSEKELGGVVRRVQYVEKMRQESRQPILVLDAGDFLQGTPYFEQFEGEAEVKFMNHTGYDIITVGNHDFDKGWPHLADLLNKGKFDAICSNIYPKGSDAPCLPPYVLLEIEGQHIALVGIMGMDSWNSISKTRQKGLEIKDPLITLDKVLPEIRPYVDLVILLSHSGIMVDRELAKHPMVDIVIGGHSHTWMTTQELVKTNIDHREKITPIFHSFRHGMLMAKLDVEFEYGRFLRTGSSIQYLDNQYEPQYGIASPTVVIAEKLFKEYQQKMEIFKTPIGECVETLPTKDKGTKLIDMGQVIANTLRECGQASVGVIPCGSIKIGIEKGPFTLGSLHKVLAHSEPLWVVTLKGNLLLSLMQQGEERWGKPRCFQYAGISMTKVESNISSLSIAGVAVKENSFYTIAGPSFFFEREFMDKHKNILPQYASDIQSVEEKYQDLRIPFAEIVKAKGLGRWVKGIEQK